MKDRIGNKLAAGDKVMVELPTSSIIGFVASLQEAGLVAIRGKSGAETKPGHVMVSCVFPLPVDPQYDAVAQLVKVYDAAKAQGPSLVTPGTSEPPKPN